MPKAVVADLDDIQRAFSSPFCRSAFDADIGQRPLKGLREAAYITLTEADGGPETNGFQHLIACVIADCRGTTLQNFCEIVGSQ